MSSLNLAYINFGGSECFGSKIFSLLATFSSYHLSRMNLFLQRFPEKMLPPKLHGLTSINFWKDSIVYDETNNQ